jgi:hemoglobin/transferrin/lactoferrin receptor protein
LSGFGKAAAAAFLSLACVVWPPRWNTPGPGMAWAQATPSAPAEPANPRTKAAPAVPSAAASAVPQRVEVTGRTERDRAREIDPRLSNSTRTLEQLEQRQPDSVFDALRDLPNVGVVGGPRASGMKFNLRGYADNEDVQVTLDGVPKGFEKYRFGGTFLEPDLLRAIEVQRGPQITSGSGALGGSVRAQTKDGADLLRPQQTFGARVRLGHTGAQQEWLQALTVYGRHGEALDALAHTLRRRADDLRLPDGSRLPLSSTRSASHLLKASTRPMPGWRVGLSAVSFQDQGAQPYDATGGEPGLFGQVQREIDDRTEALSIDGAAADGRWRLAAVLGRSHTALVDEQRPGQTPFANATTGTVTDRYRYRNDSADVQWRWRVSGGGEAAPATLELLWGWQGQRQAREVSRTRERVPGTGFEPSIPPGVKALQATFVQARWALGPLELIPGLRWDRLELTATGGTEAVLRAAGEPTRLLMERTTPSLGLVAWLPGEQASVFLNLADSFRPPLMDEAFTQGAFSRCTRFLFGPALAPRSNICGTLYQPQRAINRELGLSWSGALPWRGWRADAKLLRFEIDTTELLRSIQPVSATAVGQPGWEQRRGVEFEAALRHRRGVLRVSHGRIRGVVDEGGGTRRPSQPQPLVNAPADSRVLSGSWRVTEGFEIGGGYSHAAARRVITSVVAGQTIYGTQPRHELFHAHLRWDWSPHIEWRLAGENLGNRSYRLSDGFGGGLGAQAPGRSVRVSLVWRS